MAPLCTPADIGAMLARTFTPATPEYAQVEWICGAVSDMIRARRPQIDQWIADGVLSASLVTSVACQVVARVLNTIETGGVGVRSETHPEYSYELTASAAAGLNLTKAELALLTPDLGRAKAFSIMPG